MEKRLKKYLKNGKFEDVSKVTSKTMSAIKGKNNKSTEMRLKMALIRDGFSGFVLHEKLLSGKPDIYFRDRKLAIFIDGCYWHGCPKCGHIPKTRTEFWKAKIERNITRDNSNRAKLRKIGIKPLRFWEHQLKKKEDLKKVINKITKALQGTKNER
jgi:DNA mismatch endonuclease, patch repair protein